MANNKYTASVHHFYATNIKHVVVFLVFPHMAVGGRTSNEVPKTSLPSVFRIGFSFSWNFYWLQNTRQAPMARKMFRFNHPSTHTNAVPFLVFGEGMK